MLLTSAVRDAIATFNMAPRAINLMPKGVRKKSHLQGTAATENGTDLIYYVNALTAQSLTVTIDVAFDDFPEELVNQVAGMICGAGAIPLFGPYNGVLLGVRTAIKLVSKLVRSLADARPDLTVHHRFDFEVAGAPIPSSGYWVLSNATLNHEAFRFDLEHGLVDKATNRTYDGDEPYVVLLLDGTRNDRLSSCESRRGLLTDIFGCITNKYSQGINVLTCNAENVARHSVTITEIDEVLSDSRTIWLDLGVSRGGNDRLMFIGLTKAGRALEIGVELICDDEYVFHAMDAGEHYLKEFNDAK